MDNAARLLAFVGSGHDLHGAALRARMEAYERGDPVEWASLSASLGARAKEAIAILEGMPPPSALDEETRQPTACIGALLSELGALLLVLATIGVAERGGAANG